MAALLATALAVALGAVSVESDVRLAARGREVRIEGARDLHAGELEALPRLALLHHGRLELSLSYAPRLTLPLDLSAGTPELTSGAEIRDHGEVLHQGELAVQAGATPNLTLRFRAAGSYGRIDLLRSSIYAAEVLPTTGRLAWRSAEASGGATFTATQRTTLACVLSALQAGGADASARAVVPLRSGAAAEASVRHAASRRDEISLLADAAWSRFTPGVPVAEGAVVRAGGGWRRQLVPTASVRVVGGGAWSYSDADAARGSDVAPFAEVAVSHAPERPSMTTDVVLRLAPYMSPLTGAIDQRLEAAVTSAWRPSRAWTLQGRGTGAAARSATSHGDFRSGERQAEIGSAELRGRWDFARRGWLSFGPSVRWQRSHDPSVPTFLEWGGAVELTIGDSWPE